MPVQASTWIVVALIAAVCAAGCNTGVYLGRDDLAGSGSPSVGVEGAGGSAPSALPTNGSTPTTPGSSREEDSQEPDDATGENEAELDEPEVDPSGDDEGDAEADEDAGL